MKVVRIVTTCPSVTAAVRSAHIRSPATSFGKILTARYTNRSSRQWNKSRRVWRLGERAARCRLCASLTRDSRGNDLASPAVHESAPAASPSAIDLALNRTHMAYERALLDWIRTAASSISLGFASTSSLNICGSRNQVLLRIGQLGFASLR